MRVCFDSPVSYDCPHCGQGWEMSASDAIFEDNIEDECETTCDACGGTFQLFCGRIDVEMGVRLQDESRQDSNQGR